MTKKRLVFLVISSLFLLVGCTKKVEKAQMTVDISGNSLIGEYTGDTEDDKANGHGIITKNEVAVDGEFKDGKLVSGNVENISLEIPIDGSNITGEYSGAYNKGAKGKGKFIFEKGIVIEGEFDDNKIISASVVNYPLECEITGKKYSGQYTGAIKDGEITGNGEFKTTGINYVGEFKNGKIYGNGEFRNSTYVVSFETVNRTGKYSGNVINGLAEGKGTFTAKNSDGNKYTYEGEWKNGLFNGYGKRTFEKRTLTAEIGTFKDGEFKPTVSEWFESQGTYYEETYEISNKTKKFIDANEKLFKDKQSTKLVKKCEKIVSPNFSYSGYKKNQQKYNGKLFCISGKVFQVLRDEYDGYYCTQVAMEDNAGNIYMIRFLKKINIVENQNISIYITPLDYTTYESVNKKSIWNIECVGVCKR